jgi:hypothetical protein
MQSYSGCRQWVINRNLIFLEVEVRIAIPAFSIVRKLIHHKLPIPIDNSF